jgi:hypothetical protein
MLPKARQIIEGVRALFQDPKRHTTGEPARDERGRAIDYLSPYATCFCFVGAVSRVAHDLGASIWEREAAERELSHTIQLLTDSRAYSLVGVNENGVPVVGDDGRLLTGREGVLRVCDVALAG